MVVLLLIIIAVLMVILFYHATRPVRVIHEIKVQGTEAGNKVLSSEFVCEPEPEKDAAYYLAKLMRGEDIGYWDGPAPSPQQQEKNMKVIFDHLEKFPNGILAERNPEFVEEYLNKIDLDLPPGVTTEKSE